MKKRNIHMGDEWEKAQEFAGKLGKPWSAAALIRVCLSRYMKPTAELLKSEPEPKRDLKRRAFHIGDEYDKATKLAKGPGVTPAVLIRETTRRWLQLTYDHLKGC